MAATITSATTKWARGAQVFAVDGAGPVASANTPATFVASATALGGEWSRRELRWEFPLSAQAKVLDLLKTEFDYAPAAPVAAARPAYKPFAQMTRRERLHTELASARRSWSSHSDDNSVWNGGNDGGEYNR